MDVRFGRVERAEGLVREERAAAIGSAPDCSTHHRPPSKDLVIGHQPVLPEKRHCHQLASGWGSGFEPSVNRDKAERPSGRRSAARRRRPCRAD